MKTIQIPSPEYDAYCADIRAKSVDAPRLKNGVSTLKYACPVCGIESESRAYSTTLVGYVSPEGHDHDDNCRWFRFQCFNGHAFEVRVQNLCPSCNWEGKEWCYSCGGNVRHEAAGSGVEVERTTFVYNTVGDATVVGYKGEEKASAGYFYAPYSPLKKDVTNG